MPKYARPVFIAEPFANGLLAESPETGPICDRIVPRLKSLRWIVNRLPSLLNHQSPPVPVIVESGRIRFQWIRFGSLRPPAACWTSACSLSSNCFSSRDRRPASELTVSSSSTPIMTPVVRSLRGTVGLVFDGCDLVTPILGLGFNHADRSLFDDKNVVGRSHISLVFANSDTRTGVKI